MNTSRNSSIKRKRASNSSQAGKRSRLSAEATRHVTSVFGRLVTDAGITLSFGDAANSINIDPPLFKKKLLSSLRLHLATHQSLEDFNEAMCCYFDNVKRFYYGLLPVVKTDDSDLIVRPGGLDSLLRLLLGVELIQPRVVELLVDKLMGCSTEPTLRKQLNSREYDQLPHLILSQLMMMDFVVDGQKLCSSLLEVVDVVLGPVKCDIIQALPLIITDSEHEIAATHLNELLGDRELVAVTLSALTDLNTGTDLTAQILQSALALVRSAKLEDLPTVIAFINSHVTPRSGHELIAELRDNLDQESCFTSLPVHSSTPFKSTPSNSSEQYVVLDTIRSSLVAKKEVADSWMKAIDAVRVEEDHQVIDLYVLFVLYTVWTRRKNVRQLLLSKVKAGLFTNRLVDALFNCKIPTLNDVFSSVLSLCEHLLSSSSSSRASSFAQCLYKQAFASTDVFSRQEIVTSLVTHVGSGVDKEVNHALELLSSLLDADLKAMTRFTVIIKGVFDNLELLSVAQIRQLYSILSVLAYGHEDEELETGIQDELHVIIRKQLFHDEQRYRHMGVVGASMIIKQISCTRRPQQLDTTIATITQHNVITQQHNNSLQLSENRRRQATSMIQQVTESCKTQCDSAALFFDEMAAVVHKGNMDTQVVHFLAEQISTSFQDIYLIESTDLLPTDLGFPLEYQGGIDSQEEGSIALNIFPLLMKEDENSQSRQKSEGLLSMCAHFRLLWVCEEVLNKGSLEGVDALLGCPVVMCSQEKLNMIDFEELSLEQRQTICHSLLHCINWKRELVSAFAPSSEADMQCKVLTRLKDITRLQTQLEKCLAAAPCQLFPLDESKKGKMGKKSRSKIDASATTHLNGDETTKLQDQTVDKSTHAITSVQERVKTHFRELQLSAFQVLGYSPVSASQLDTSQLVGSIETELHPPQLLLLLQELASKSASCFSRFTRKSQSEGTGPSDNADNLAIVMVTNLLPPLCNHLEKTSIYFQAQLVDDDGVVDARHPEEGENLVQSLCLQTILKIITSLFSWSPLSDQNHADILLKAVKTIARRMSQSDTQLETASCGGLASLAVQYLSKFSEFLPSLSSAHLLVKLFVAICKTTKSDEHLKRTISDHCQKMLKSSWPQYQNESNSLRNAALECIVKFYMDWSDDPLQTVEMICENVVPELMGEDAQMESDQFKTLTISTFPCYYRAMMNAVVSVVKDIPPPSRNMHLTGVVVSRRFMLLEVSAKVFYMLINLVKSFDTRPVLKAALKYGNKYVEVFLRSGIPVVDSLFKARKDDVTSLLKAVQQSTRCLQHYCTHSKVIRDTTVIKLIPKLKRSLETLVFKVKDVLTNHNCLEAFWVGNLKNRDLQGHEILSQYSQQTRSSSSTHSEDGEEEEEDVSDMSDED